MKEISKDPLWSGLLSVLGVFYGWWASSIYYHANLQEGPGVMGIVLIAIVVFMVIMALVPLGIACLLIPLKSKILRALILSAAFIIFLAGYGQPSVWLLIIGVVIFIYTYREVRREKEDADELEKL